MLRTSKIQSNNFSFWGVGKTVPILSGKNIKYVNFDNSATTSPFTTVVKKVNGFLQWYASVHRGSGYKSILSTQVLENCRSIIAEFVNADPDLDTVIFGINTTTCINKLVRKLDLTKNDFIINTDVEHSSNELPWRKWAKVINISTNELGELNLEGLRKSLKDNFKKTKLVALSGASNITGYLSPIHEAAKIAHEFGVPIFVDCAQLAPHRKIDMLPHNDSGHLDYIAFSGHKMYAPYGLGVLIGHKELFDRGIPDDVGGGTVDMITRDDQYWSSLPNRESAGTPNAVGAVALATTVQILSSITFDKIAQHEQHLTSLFLKGLKQIPSVKIYGSTDENIKIDRLGVIPFNIEGLPHGLVAAILGCEYGIGVRHGVICQYEFIRRTLDIPDEHYRKILSEIKNKQKENLYGIVRASLALYNTADDVKYFIKAVRKISQDGHGLKYKQDKISGEFMPIGWEPKLKFSIKLSNHS